MRVLAKTRHDQEGIELEDTTTVLSQYIGKYLHFTSADKVGINTRAKYPGINPIGVYGHTITKEIINAIAHGNYSRFTNTMRSVNLYKNIFVFDFAGTVLDIRSLTLQDMKKIIDFFDKKQQLFLSRDELVRDVKAYFVGANGARGALEAVIEEVATNLNINNKNLATNVILRELGYTAIKGFISAGDPNEVCVLDPSKVVVLDKLNNPMFDDKQYQKTEEYRQYYDNIQNAAEQFSESVK